MRLLNNYICVIFITDHNHKIGIGLNGMPIIRAEKWLNTEAEEADAPSRFDENENYLETNPQICIVKHPSAYHGYQPGDKLFLHYMAWEWAEATEYGYVVEADQILFKINEDETLMVVNDTYLGEFLYEREEETETGFVTVKEKKDSLKIKITHLARNHNEAFGFGIGDVIISIDKNNYQFNYNGGKYIKLTRDEIVSKLTENICQKKQFII